MKFSRAVFRIAGIYGLLILAIGSVDWIFAFLFLAAYFKSKSLSPAA
jgi:hypothetical protein